MTRRPAPDRTRDSSPTPRERLARVERYAASGPGAWITACLVVLAGWPVSTLQPRGSSLDASWQVGIVMATRQGLDFGSDIVFTYGPLGFLGLPPTLWTGATAATALLFTLVLHVTFVRMAVLHAQRSLPWLGAVVLAWLLHAFWGFQGSPEFGTVTILLVALYLLEHPPSGCAATLWMCAGAGLATVLLLVKFNEGIGSFGIVGLTTLALARRKPQAVAALAAVTLAYLLGLWLLAGQGLGKVVPWLLASFEVAEGYTEAMSVEYVERVVEYAVGAVLIGLLCVLAWRDRRLTGAWPLLVGAWFLYLAGKHGFVRHDGHSAGFFASLAVLPLLLRTSRPWTTVAFALASSTCAMLALGGEAPPPVLSEAARAPQTAATQVLTILDGDRRAAAQAEARALVGSQVSLPPEVLAAVGRSDVHVEPYNTEVVWLHELAWEPLPVFQSYTAYTAGLDEGNAAGLRSKQEAPDVVLRERVESIDERLTAFEAPRTTLALLCHYRQELETERWLVMRKSADRCGAPQELQEIEVRDRTPITVPVAPEGTLLYASLDLGFEPLPALSSIAFKPFHHLHAALDGAPAKRLVKATVEGPLVLRVPPGLPQLPSAVLYDQSTELLRFDNLPDGSRLTFYAVPLAP